MTTRKQIRDAAKAAIATVYRGKIFTSRLVDFRNTEEYLRVYFESGEARPQAQFYLAVAQLVVSFGVNGTPSDDSLDITIDAANAALIANLQAQLIAAGDADGVQIVLQSFEYGDDEQSQFATVFHTYEITYSP